MKTNYIIATAGHVDHGKTSLIKALTGKDCDTHPEEKQRGITIHLGFSHLQLSDDIHAGIVDVPGHKDFIDTMISGINGIDLVLFIIAADECFMPQTTEHLQILKILGVKKGVIILTKCDLIDKESYALVKEEIKCKVKNSFLERAPIIGTSVKSGMNIDKIKPLLLKALNGTNKSVRFDKASYPSKKIKPSQMMFKLRLKAIFKKGSKSHDSLPGGNRRLPLRYWTEASSAATIGNRSLPLHSVGEEPIRPDNIFIINEVRDTKIASPTGFRLYPDRYFQVKGFGSVLTGTVLSGSLDKAKNLYSVSSKKEFKLRKMEAYGKETQIISKGQRASLNLTNFHKDDYEKGIMLCSTPYSATALIDVELSLLENASFISQWATVEFYTATIQTQAKIHLIDKDKLFPKEKCFAQLHLNKAIAVCYDDKFIIRNSSGINTLGGGRVIDAFPLHHRRRKEKIKEQLKLRAQGSIQNLICSEIEKSVRPISIDQISQNLYKKIELTQIKTLPEQYTQYNNWFWHKIQQDRLEIRIAKYLLIAHKQNPLDNMGKGKEEFVSLVTDFPEKAKLLVITNVLESMLKKGILEKRKDTYALVEHKIKLDSTDHSQINWVDQFILNQRMKLPLWSELKERGALRNITEAKLKQMLFYLTGRKRLIHHEGEYLHTLNVSPIRMKLLEYLSLHPEGISVAEFRDLVVGNRKICIVLLNIFDNEGIINRIDDKRFITEKGRQVLMDNGYL